MSLTGRWLTIGALLGVLLVPQFASSAVRVPTGVGQIIDVAPAGDGAMVAVGVKVTAAAAASGSPHRGGPGIWEYPLLMGDATGWSQLSMATPRPWDDASPLAVQAVQLTDGRVLVVWSGSKGVRWTTLRPGQAPAEASEIPGAHDPAAALALRATPDGRAVLLWIGGAVHAAVFDGAEGSWSTQETIGRVGSVMGTITPGAAQPVDLQMAADGTMTAVWWGSGPSKHASSLMTAVAAPATGYRFALAIAVPGTAGARRAETSNPWTPDLSSLQVAANGAAVAVWTRGLAIPRRKGGMITERNYYAFRSPRGTWSKVRPLPNQVVGNRSPLRRISQVIPVVGRGGDFSLIGLSSGERDAAKAVNEVVVLRVSPSGMAQPRFRVVARQSRIYFLVAGSTTTGKELVVFSGITPKAGPSPLRRLIGHNGTWRAGSNLRPPLPKASELGSFQWVDIWPVGSRVLVTWQEPGGPRTALM